MVQPGRIIPVFGAHRDGYEQFWFYSCLLKVEFAVLDVIVVLRTLAFGFERSVIMVKSRDAKIPVITGSWHPFCD